MVSEAMRQRGRLLVFFLRIIKESSINHGVATNKINNNKKKIENRHRWRRVATNQNNKLKLQIKSKIICLKRIILDGWQRLK